MRTGPGASTVTLMPRRLTSPRSDSPNVFTNAYVAGELPAGQLADALLVEKNIATRRRLQQPENA